MTTKVSNPVLIERVRLFQDLFEVRNGYRPTTDETFMLSLSRLMENEFPTKDTGYWLDILENAEPHLYEVCQATEGIISTNRQWRANRLKEAVGCKQEPPLDDSFMRVTTYQLTSKSPENPGQAFYLTGDNRDMVNNFLVENWKDRTLPIRFILCKWIQSDYLMEIFEDTDESRVHLHIGQQYDPEKLDALDLKLKRPFPESISIPCSREEKGKKTPQRLTWRPKKGTYECWDIDPKTKRQKKLWMRGTTCKNGLASVETMEDD